MAQSEKIFAGRFKTALDRSGIPADAIERKYLVSKLLRIKRAQAHKLLNGLVLPDDFMLSRIEDQLGVNTDSLMNQL